MLLRSFPTKPMILWNPLFGRNATKTLIVLLQTRVFSSSITANKLRGKKDNKSPNPPPKKPNPNSLIRLNRLHTYFKQKEQHPFPTVFCYARLVRGKRDKFLAQEFYLCWSAGEQRQGLYQFNASFKNCRKKVLWPFHLCLWATWVSECLLCTFFHPVK